MLLDSSAMRSHVTHYRRDTAPELALEVCDEEGRVVDQVTVEDCSITQSMRRPDPRDIRAERPHTER